MHSQHRETEFMRRQITCFRIADWTFFVWRHFTDFGIEKKRCAQKYNAYVDKHYSPQTFLQIWKFDILKYFDIL